MKCTLTTVSCLVAFLLIGELPNVNAATVTYAVNSSLSSLTLSGGVAGLTYLPQSTGSSPQSNLTDFWTGTINADLTGGVLTFSGGSTITALLHPNAPFSSAPIPPPAGVQNYGVTASGSVPSFGGFTTVNGYYHDLALDILSGTATNGLTPTGMTIKYTSGRVDAGVAIPGPPFTLATGADLTTIAAAANTTASSVSLPGAFTTLTLPVVFTTTGGSGRNETWTGTIVATLVPEPATGLLMVFSTGLFFNRRFLRR